MHDTDNLGTFFTGNKKLVKDYLDARLEAYKLKFIGILSKSAGYFIWIIVSFLLLLLFFIFLGLVGGFWLSHITGSYVKGFGIVTILILVKMIVLALLRKPIFVNPIIRNIINRAHEDKKEEEKQKEKEKER